MEKISVILKEIEDVKKSVEQEVAQYKSDREAELIQKLHDENYEGNEAETKKIESELTEISESRKKLYDSNAKIYAANQKLENEISNRIKETEIKKKEVTDKVKEIEENKAKIQELITINKDELTRMKKNMDMLEAHKEIPNWKQHYESIRNEMKPLLEKNGKLSKEIKQLEDKKTNLNNSIKEYSTIIDELTNKNYDKIIKREKAQEQQIEKQPVKQEEKQQESSKTNPQPESSQSNQKPEPEEKNTGTAEQPPVENENITNDDPFVGFDEWYSGATGQAPEQQPEAKGEQTTGETKDSSLKDRIINRYEEQFNGEDEQTTGEAEQPAATDSKISLILIRPGKYDKTLLEYNGETIELLSSNGPIERDSISDEILEKLVQAKEKTDPLIVKYLRENNEDLLKDYLDICIAHKKGEIPAPEKLENFPTIVYRYAKKLRTNENLDTNEKIEILGKAEQTKKMFEDLKQDNIKLKMGVMDKMYFGFHKFINKFKKQPKQITAGQGEQMQNVENTNSSEQELVVDLKLAKELDNAITKSWKKELHCDVPGVTQYQKNENNSREVEKDAEKSL